MTPARTMLPLRWPGIDTLKAARAAIRSRIPVEIELPLEVHFALHKHLHPERKGAHSEDIDTSGGAELLVPICAVAGLNELRGLQGAVRRAHYHVRLKSPEPRLQLLPPRDGV